MEDEVNEDEAIKNLDKTIKVDSGGRPNYTGTQLEKVIFNRLVEEGYEYTENKQFMPAICIEQPRFSMHYLIGKTIYSTDLFCDFILYHPIKHPENHVIESKWQEVSGSVDEKYPFLVTNIKECSPYSTTIVLDGGGYKKGAEKWLKSQVGGNLLNVFTLREFMKWANSNEI